MKMHPGDAIAKLKTELINHFNLERKRRSRTTTLLLDQLERELNLREQENRDLKRQIRDLKTLVNNGT